MSFRQGSAMALMQEIPKGVKVLLPEVAAKKRWVEEQFLGVFTRWGFQEVVTPTFEYFDAIAPGLGIELRDKTFTMIERESGSLLVLRPDITPQIARFASTLLKERPRPLRLCYVSNVFRYVEPQAGRAREFFQAGVELMGLDSPEADAEMIAMAVEGLMAVGLDDFHLSVSDIGFFSGVLEELGVPASVEMEIRQAVQRRDRSALEEISRREKLATRQTHLLPDLLGLVGKGEEVLEKVLPLVETPRCRAALEKLSRILKFVDAYGFSDHITVDLCEIRGFDYYTGMVFEGFTPHLGYEICGGGRYDRLLEKFGAPAPATGFAIDVERVLLALERQGDLALPAGADVLLIEFRSRKGEAVRVARNLRSCGLRVARDIIRRELEGSVAYARTFQIPWAVVLGGHGVLEGQAKVVEVARGVESSVEISRLAEFLQERMRRL